MLTLDELVRRPIFNVLSPVLSRSSVSGLVKARVRRVRHELGVVSNPSEYPGESDTLEKAGDKFRRSSLNSARRSLPPAELRDLAELGESLRILPACGVHSVKLSGTGNANAGDGEDTAPAFSIKW